MLISVSCPAGSAIAIPTSAGYHVIGDESARFLAKLIREKKNARADVKSGGPAKIPVTGPE